MQGFSFPFPIDQKYIALRTLGKGGSGQAVLAKKGKELVAVKFLNLSLAKNPKQAIHHFKKEFLTLKKLNHLHIAKLYDFGFDDNLKLYYFAGEYLEAEEIHKACQKLSLDEIEKLFVQALQALHYLHTYAGAGLRHNDIKAPNILVTHNSKEEPQLKLIDFGLANFSPLDVKGGTASYMSPEQIVLTFNEMEKGKKLPKPDHRTDLYSLGVLWYLCLTGVNPFLIEHDRTATLKKHFGPSPVPPSQIKKGIPEYLDTIIGKLLQPNPTERYENAAEVLQTLNYLSKKSYSVIPASFRKYYLPEGEWIGQSQLWNSLKEKWGTLSASDNPQPAVVWVVGEQGQGKTKLLEHFKNYAQAHLSHSGRVLLLHQNTQEALAEWISEIKRETADKLTGKASEALVIAVDNLTKDHPAWPTLEQLFEKIAYAKRWNNVSSVPWLFLFTISGTTEKKSNHGFEEHTLTLKNFDIKQLKELVQKISPHKGVEPPEKFIQKLKNHTEGNPLFVTTLLQELGAKGLLWNDSGAWHPALFQTVGIDFNQLSIPKDQTTLLLKIWTQCNESEKKLLEFLSCFSDGAKENELNATNGIQNLFDAGILTTNEKGRLLFKNPFLQRTIYNKIPETQKQKYHQTIADFYKKQNRPTHQIAYHLAKGTNKEVRLNALHELALFNEQTGKISEALENRKAQLNLLTKAPLPQHLTVVLHIIKLCDKLRLRDEALEWIKKYEKQTRRSKSLIGWQAALLREKGLLFSHEHKLREARSCFEKALRLISKSKNHLKEQLILRNTIGKTWLDERKIDKAIAIYKATRKAAEKLGPKEFAEIGNNDLGYCYLIAEQPKLAEETLRSDLAVFENSGNKMRLTRCHFLLATCLRRLTRNFDEAVKHYQSAAGLARDMKDYDWLMRIYNGLAATYLDRAQKKSDQNIYKQALHYFQESLAFCQFIKQKEHNLDFETAVIYLNLGNVYKDIGNFSKARDFFNTVISVFSSKKLQHPQEWTRLCESYAAAAECLVEEKKSKEAELQLKRAWSIAKNSPALLEHKFAIQLLWAETAKALHKKKDFKKHLSLAHLIKQKHHIHPTLKAQKKLKTLEKV